MASWKSNLVVFCARMIMRVVGSTQRLQLVDPAGFTSRKEPAVLAFWHDELFLLPWVFSRLNLGMPLCAMTSRSKDGRMIARVIKSFGMRSVGGSTSKGGAAALHGMLRQLEDGAFVGITPDGPRGPRHCIQPGVFHLARKGKVPIIPVRVRARWRVRFLSWDRFMLPLPFSPTQVWFGEPIPYDSPELEQRLRDALESDVKK